MSKSDITKQLERSIKSATSKMGTFGCFEVTVNNNGNDERIDYLTYETKGTWRCYEIKSSLSDFNSSAAHTFIGHFNYYVMTQELYEQVKERIPKHIGVYVYGWCEKKPKKQELQLDHNHLMYCMMRSLYHRHEKLSKSTNEEVINKYNRRISKLENQKISYYKQLRDLESAVAEEYGYHKLRELSNRIK